jgi:hypothetical protein
MVENSCRTVSTLMLATERVAERVAEARLQRLDDEPRTELVDGLFRQ